MTVLRKYLRRYTDLPALIYLLSNQCITLLDPETWDDKNDSHFVRLYKEKSGFQSVLALCFTQTSETYHHWRVFANGPSGVAISFKRDELLRGIRKKHGLRLGRVKYVKLPEMRHRKLATQDLPFLKRYPFEHEIEYRILLESSENLKACDIPISLSCIDKITLSPWLNYALFKKAKEILKKIKGCEDLKIVRSTLISNEEWKNFGESSTGSRRRRAIQRG